MPKEVSREKELQTIYGELLQKILVEIESQIPSSFPMYNQALPYFFSFLCSNCILLDEIDEAAVVAFIEDRYLKGNRDTSIQIYLRAIDESFAQYFGIGLPTPGGRMWKSWFMR